jgi:hypothetical protein
MNKFSLECDRIIEEMRTNFTAFDEAKKLEYKTEINEVLAENISSADKAAKFKEIKKRFKQDLYSVNFQNIQSLYVKDANEKLILPEQNRKKVNDIVETAIELLSNEREDTHVFRRLSFRSLAESKSPRPQAKVL